MAQKVNPVDAIVDHHAELIGEVKARVDALIGAVGLGDPSAPAAAAVLEFLDSTVFPHAAAEEKTFYPAAAKTEPRLIASLLREHELLHALATDLAKATEDSERAAIAGAISYIFTHHAGVENDFVLPTLEQDPDVDLTALLGTMHDAFDTARHPQAAELDVRTLPHMRRHEEIFGRLERLGGAETLLIVNDHDPAPLRYQLDALWPGTFSWSYQESGPAVWKVAIGRR